MEELKLFKDIRVTDKSLKKCSRCKEMKDREEDFHRGASMCKECRREYDMERNSGGSKELIASMRRAILELGERVEQLTKRVEELEGNNKAENADMINPDEDKGEEEMEKQEEDSIVDLQETMQKNIPEESSEEDTEESLRASEKKPKDKARSDKPDLTNLMESTWQKFV
ncbi:hypothetical protein EDD11_010446, partial [Mortierella claussenii]